MIELLNPALWGGLAVLTAPVLIHLAHRRKIRRVEWGAMRFLREMLLRSRRRLVLHEWLLLLVRALILAFLALALLRPVYETSSNQPAIDDARRGGRTAAVLLIDDSVSTGAGRTATALDTMKDLALAYLNSLHPGDEVSLLKLSQLSGTQPDPTFDLESAKHVIENLRPTSSASDVPALIEAGLEQLHRHLNPSAELVLVQDGRRDGWEEGDRTRWEALRQRWLAQTNAHAGTRERPHLILLSPEAAAVESNVAIESVAAERAVLPVNRPVTIRVRLLHSGSEPPTPRNLRLLVNGRRAAERPVDFAGKPHFEATFTHQFLEAGWHVVEAAVEGGRDLLPLDDRRSAAVLVDKNIRVLLVDGKERTALEGRLGYFHLALDPESNSDALFQVVRVDHSKLSSQNLHDFRVVVLGDVPALDPSTILRIEKYLLAGGGLLMGVGDQTSPDLVNRFWGGRGGFLPARLKEIGESTPPSMPVSSMAGHPAFAAFGIYSGAAWKEVKVRRYFKVALENTSDSGFQKLLVLDNGDPLIVEGRRGLGRAVLVTTTLNADWNDLPIHPAYVALVRGLTAYLGSAAVPPHNLAPGDRLVHSPFDSQGSAEIQAIEPNGNTLALQPAAWEGRPAWMSEPLLEHGAYRVLNPESGDLDRYAVAIAPNESTLDPLPSHEMEKRLAGLPYQNLKNAFEVSAHFAATRESVRELWRVCLGLTLLFLFLETILTRAEGKPAANRSAAPARSNSVPVV